MGRVLAVIIWIITLLSVLLFVSGKWWFPAAISEHAPALDRQRCAGEGRVWPGWTAMARRVAMGTALLCDAAVPQPYAGYFHRESRDCRDESNAIASAQMLRARDLARAGERVTLLDIRR